MQLLEGIYRKEMPLLSGLEVRLALSQEMTSPESFSLEEKVQYLAVRGTAREASWLRGRAALKGLLASMDLGSDTSGVRFPNSKVSLTHSQEWAVAVGCDGSGITGIGVDLEIHRSPRPGAARFFLQKIELDWLDSLEESERPAHLLRLWTVKEALFKADPHNVDRGIREYRLLDPSAVSGEATHQEDGSRHYAYTSLRLPEGYLTVAVSRLC